MGSPNNINRLDIGKVVKDKKSKSTGERVLLCTLALIPNMLVLCHFNGDNELIDKRCYAWYTKSARRLVMKTATADWRLWRGFMMMHEPDFEAATIKLTGKRLIL